MKYFKYGLVMILCVFSFYFSDRMILYVESLSPIMKNIKSVAPAMKEVPVDAIIEGNTIIPGKNGKVVNERESYLKMNDFGTFNETFFVYDYIKPKISLYDNLDKIIIKGNKKDKVSLIVDNVEVEKYLDEKKINYAKPIAKTSDYVENENIEYLNIFNNEEEFNNLFIFLKRKKINKKICLVGYTNTNICKTNGYFLVMPSVHVYKSNLAESKSLITSGSIIFIHDNVSLTEGKVLLNYIKSSNLEFEKLSVIINE